MHKLEYNQTFTLSDAHFLERCNRKIATWLYATKTDYRLYSQGFMNWSEYQQYCMEARLEYYEAMKHLKVIEEIVKEERNRKMYTITWANNERKLCAMTGTLVDVISAAAAFDQAQVKYKISDIHGQHYSRANLVAGEYKYWLEPDVKF